MLSPFSFYSLDWFILFTLLKRCRNEYAKHSLDV